MKSVKRYFMLIFAIAILTLVSFGNEKTVQADEGNQIVLKLPPQEGNPRNSEGDFVRLKDGRIMFIYTHFVGGAGDHAKANLSSRYSNDDGKTWTKEDRVIVKNEGGFNVMSVSLLRLHSGEIALFYLRKNSHLDCRPVLRTSTDEGKTWSEPTECVADEVMYCVVNNDRIIQLKNGRILIPMALHNRKSKPKRDMRGTIFCYYSDDNGKSWKRSQSQFKLFNDKGKRITAQEPGIVQLLDGRVMMFIRTDAGCQMICYSSDNGDTWSKPEISQIKSPVSPASIERIPKTNDLVLVWNNHESIPSELKGKRTPFTIAISKDDGKTWAKTKNIADNPTGWYCYTAVEFVGDHILLGHCAGDRSKNNGLAETHITRISLDWIYK
jgi:sialidase-1